MIADREKAAIKASVAGTLSARTNKMFKSIGMNSRQH